MKLGLWLRLLWCVGAYCGCGGAEFMVGVFPDGGQPLTALSADAGDAEQASQEADVAPAMASDAGERKIAHHDDAGDAGELAAVRDDAAPDVAPSPAPPDAADEPPPPPPPPPALCCMTPCGGSTPAPITCGNGGAWTCAAGSCTDRACAVGAVCDWMGSCTGRVAVCP